MAARPKQRSSIARRVFLAMLLSLTLALGGLAGLIWWAYETVVTTLAGQPQDALALLLVENALLKQALELWPYAAGLLAVILLLAWALSRWATRPLSQLVAAALMVGSGEARGKLPVRAVGEIGALARSFDDLSRSLQRSSLDLQEQNRSLSDSLRRLEGLLRVGQELNTSLDADQMTRRFVETLRHTFGYERVGVALVEGEFLAYHFSPAAGDESLAPPTRAPLTERSIAGRAALTGQMVRVDDLRAAAFPATPGLNGARSELAAPVINDRQLLAVIIVQSTRPAAFGPPDEQQIAALASLLGVALTNSNMFEVEQMRRMLAQAIDRIAHMLSATVTGQRVPDLILDQLATVVAYDRGALALIDGESIAIVAARGFAGAQPLLATRLEEAPLIAEIARQGHPIILDDAQHDPRYRPLGGDGARSWLGAPLSRQGQVGGVLILESDQPGRYTEEQLHAVGSLAGQAALAMENARLYAEAQERALQLEVVTRLTQEVSTRDVNSELPGILRTIIHQIRRVVPCDHATLTFYNEEDDTFTVETVYDFTVRDWSELPAGYRVPAIHTPWQTACRTATPLVQSELGRSAFAHDRTLADSGLRSGTVVPIVGGNRAIGTLDFATREPGAYGQTQIATLLELSHYLGTVLHNARLAREREEAATKLARTQEHLNLVDKVRAVGQLASGVAHDFNNLLAGILGNAQLLLYEIRDEDQRSLLRIIEQASKDGAETVRRLQGFARMEHDTPMTEVRLDMLARDAIDLTRPRWRDVAQSRGARIEIDRRLQPVAPIAGRPGELREVLTNLIINAVDALPGGGKITVATYDSRAETGEVEGVVVEVADTGTGMTPEVRGRIFDPFFTTKGEHGTGLGLAVSLGIVQSHGGQIEVESEAGAGTRFIIRLPVRVAEQAGKSRRRQPVEIMPGHILFVEGEAMIRDATVRLLTRWGHRVTQASSGVEALERFLPDMYDVVISDLGMPDMNGWDLLQQIKQRDRRVPTVLITGWGRQFDDEETRTRGVDFVLEKPFDQDDLREALAETMGPK